MPYVSVLSFNSTPIPDTNLGIRQGLIEETELRMTQSKGFIVGIRPNSFIGVGAEVYWETVYSDSGGVTKIGQEGQESGRKT